MDLHSDLYVIVTDDFLEGSGGQIFSVEYVALLLSYLVTVRY